MLIKEAVEITGVLSMTSKTPFDNKSLCFVEHLRNIVRELDHGK